MVDIKTLLPELKKLVTDLSEDLLARSTASAEIDAGLREAYTQIEKGGRTADAFEVWREDYLDQVAVAWVLGCVFVRFMEDNHLIDECWLAGEGDRSKQAADSHELYFREHPRESDREYFEYVFHEVGKIPACEDLFAEGKTPLWAVGPSGDAAMNLLAFWREIDTDSGQLKRTFDVEAGDTRFLGDLYQDLSERARKKYALLQTPVFVEEFILDRTLDPAIDEFGLDEVRMIDPTCGSGHFLLGGLARLFKLWVKREENNIVAAQKALDGVWGVDVNPFAVAIARFRLIVEALRACDIKSLKKAPAWKIHLATGDSLLFGNRWDHEGKKKGEQQFFSTDDESWAPEIYACEDRESVTEVLGQQYHVVVGNPPYITPKDKGLNNAYRSRYATCHREYSLAVPFAERFFDLALSKGGFGSGYVGTITANSFMKREFGKKFIESFLPSVELTHIIDTAGAYVPGHGTPTVILFGRNHRPISDHVRAVLGITGEPTTPEDPALGKVWQSIIRNVDQANVMDDFVSTSDIERSVLYQHPWTLTGGGAIEVKTALEQVCKKTLSHFSNDVGFICITKLDDVFCQSREMMSRLRFEKDYVKEFGVGEDIRDWEQHPGDQVIFPYDERIETVKESQLPNIIKFMNSFKTVLNARKVFGGKTYREAGKPWYEYGQIPKHRLQTPMAIAFAFIGSHNHFVLDRNRTVFKQSAPVIKLQADASESLHLQLLGLLNSSVVCFWLKQVSHQKQLTGGDGVRVQSRSKVPYEFAGTQLKRLPIPDVFLVEGALRQRIGDLAQQIEECGKDLQRRTGIHAVESGLQSGDILGVFQRFQIERPKIRSKMVLLQEELDFTCYAAFGLVDESLLCADVERFDVSVDVGNRAFEIQQQRNLDGFPVPSEIPSEWPNELQDLWNRRLAAIGESRELSVIEDDHYKRRWIGRQGLFNHTARQSELALACREWLLRRLETEPYWGKGNSQFMLRSTSDLAHIAQTDSAFGQVANVLMGREDFDIVGLMNDLVLPESVPIVPASLYKATGIRKHKLWMQSWDQERRFDMGEAVGDIKTPPKFALSDFQKPEYWRLRNKLNVPMERFVSFPSCERDGDPEPVVGWAGWNHLEQATAIVAYYDARKREGWTAERLTPLLAALDQLLPWIHQWHPEIDPEYNETAGTSFQTLLESEAQELGLTLEQIRSWTPPAKKKATKKKAAKKPRKKSKSAEATEGE